MLFPECPHCGCEASHAKPEAPAKSREAEEAQQRLELAGAGGVRGFMQGD
jgi:hypothetical protein